MRLDVVFVFWRTRISEKKRKRSKIAVMSQVMIMMSQPLSLTTILMCQNMS